MTQPASPEMLELVRGYRDALELEALYFELIREVGNVYPGETRHQTALRYLKEAERERPGQCAAAVPEIDLDRLVGKDSLGLSDTWGPGGAPSKVKP